MSLCVSFYGKCRYAGCLYAKCHFVECHYVNAFMVSVAIQNVIMLSVIMLSVLALHFSTIKHFASVILKRHLHERFVTHCCQNAAESLPVAEQHVFCILIDYRGRHRKGVAIYNAT